MICLTDNGSTLDCFSAPPSWRVGNREADARSIYLKSDFMVPRTGTLTLDSFVRLHGVLVTGKLNLYRSIPLTVLSETDPII